MTIVVLVASGFGLGICIGVIGVDLVRSRNRGLRLPRGRR